MGCKALQLEDYFQLIDSNADNSRKSFTYNELGKTLENPAGNEYNLFTGKPQIGGLGYAFLFRNYRSNLGKWQTNDPIGYPAGYNNFAYVNNRVTKYIDWQGTDPILVSSGNTQSGENTWPEPSPDGGYASYAAAVAATAGLLSALRTTIGTQVYTSVSSPYYIVGESWSNSYVVRPMVGGNGRWYVAKVSTTFTYSIYE